MTFTFRSFQNPRTINAPSVANVTRTARRLLRAHAAASAPILLVSPCGQTRWREKALVPHRYRQCIDRTNSPAWGATVLSIEIPSTKLSMFSLGPTGLFLSSSASLAQLINTEVKVFLSLSVLIQGPRQLSRRHIVYQGYILMELAATRGNRTYPKQPNISLLAHTR
jgi:hypothetical protein